MIKDTKLVHVNDFFHFYEDEEASRVLSEQETALRKITDWSIYLAGGDCVVATGTAHLLVSGIGKDAAFAGCMIECPFCGAREIREEIILTGQWVRLSCCRKPVPIKYHQGDAYAI